MCGFSEKTKVFLRRIKYPDEKKRINHITLLGILGKCRKYYIRHETTNIESSMYQIPLHNVVTQALFTFISIYV
jgi:hypothetical protein